MFDGRLLLKNSPKYGWINHLLENTIRTYALRPKKLVRCHLPKTGKFWIKVEFIAAAKVVKTYWGKGEAFGQIIYSFDSQIFRPNASPLLS